MKEFIHKMVVLKESEPVRRAAEAMRDRKVGAIVVTDGHGRVSGILTDRDIVNHVVADDQPASTQIQQIMTRAPILVDRSTETEQVIQLMRENGIRRVPVVEQTGPNAMICVGIVTLDDLILSQAINPAQLRDVVRAQLLRRVGSRVPEALRRAGRFHEELESFYSNVINRVEECYDLTVPEVAQFCEMVLQGFVRRLHHTAARHLISQLPQTLQEKLEQVTGGPDTHVNTLGLMSEIMKTFNVDDSTAYGMLTRFCSALELWCDRKVLAHVKAQLPKEFQALFALRGAEQARKFKAA